MEFRVATLSVGARGGRDGCEKTNSFEFYMKGDNSQLAHQWNAHLESANELLMNTGPRNTPGLGDAARRLLALCDEDIDDESNPASAIYAKLLSAPNWVRVLRWGSPLYLVEVTKRTDE